MKSIQKFTALLLALLLIALPALAETGEAADSETAVETIFMPSILGELYNTSIAQLFAQVEGVDPQVMQDSMEVRLIDVEQPGTVCYSSIDGRFALLFEAADEYTSAAHVRAVSTYEEDKGREVPLFPFFMVVASLSGDMDFFAWAMGEHDVMDFYESEHFTATYTTSSEDITVTLAPAK